MKNVAEMSKMTLQKRGKWTALKVIVIVILVWILLAVGIIFCFYSNSNNLKSERSQKELSEMKSLYGNCSPAVVKETAFESDLVQAETIEEKESTKKEFIGEIERCKKLSHLAVCAASGCRWK